MTYDITTRHVPDETVVSIRGRTDRAHLSPFVGTTFGQLYGRMQRVGVAPAADGMVIYHEFEDDGIDAEVCVPIPTDADLDRLAGGGLVPRVIAGSLVAQTLHLGAYDTLADAYAAVQTWIREHHGRSIGPARERYRAGPGDGIPATAYRTLVEFPIADAAVAVG